MKYLLVLVALALPNTPAPERKPTVYEQNFACCEYCITQENADFGFMVKEDTCACFKKKLPGGGLTL